MLRWFRVETYKFLHSSLLWIHLLVPLLGIGIFIAYYRISPWPQEQKVAVYLQLLAMAFPVLIGVISAMVAEREAQAGSFQMELTTPCSKYIPTVVSCCVLIVFGLLASTIAVVGFGSLFRLIGQTEFPLSFYMRASVMLLVGNIPLYLLQLIVGFVLGKGATLGLGVVGSLLSGLLITGLGEHIWFYLPWGTGIRLVSRLAANPEGLSLTDSEIARAVCFLIGCSLICVLLIVLGSSKWEGRKGEEE